MYTINMRLMWCLIGLLTLAINIYASDCSQWTLQQTLWVRCNEETQRKVEEVKHQTSLDREEQIRQACCVISDTITCWVDSLRSECGDAVANNAIKTAKFDGDCASWTYLDSISLCQLWYRTWWFITIIAILAIVIIAFVVFWVFRKSARLFNGKIGSV